jgi:UDP-N-acetylglucosamine 2-epimerase (non-hydrolysing)
MKGSQLRTVLCVVGARPNFMKIAPIMRAIARTEGLSGVLVHTGQHYDEAMNDRFFRQLRIAAPDVTLEVGSGSHAWQTAEIMRRFEPVLDDVAPDCLLVVGDVNSTIATALVASKKGVRIAHVEAGLRSRDRTMPEEINRVLTDAISDRLYVTEAAAIDNLVAEGIAQQRIVFAGNVMIDSLIEGMADAQDPRQTLAAHGVDPDRFPANGRYALLTLHRPSNVDHRETLASLTGTLGTLAESLPLVFTVHPRTRIQLQAHGLSGFLDHPGVIALPPVGYREMLGLMHDAALVLTDSGGLQEETTALGIPCLTLRENTERPVTIEQGTNTLVGTDPARILEHADRVAASRGARAAAPEGWDGHAAERIVSDLARWLEASGAGPRGC